MAYLPVMQDAASIGEALAVLMGWNPAVLVPLTEVIRRELMADRLGGVLVLVDRVMAKLLTHQEAGGDVVFVTLAMVCGCRGGGTASCITISKG